MSEDQTGNRKDRKERIQNTENGNQFRIAEHRS